MEYWPAYDAVAAALESLVDEGLASVRLHADGPRYGWAARPVEATERHVAAAIRARGHLVSALKVALPIAAAIVLLIVILLVVLGRGR